MGGNTSIEWTDSTWNPVTGCTKVSPGCKHCYAERLALRLQAMGNRRYQNGFAVTLHPDLLDIPLRWRQPRRVFVNSMSDLFHEAIPDDFIRAVFRTMARARLRCASFRSNRSSVQSRRCRSPVKAGDRILFGKYAGQEITLEGEEYLIMKEDEVLAVIEGHTKKKLVAIKGKTKKKKKK